MNTKRSEIDVSVGLFLVLLVFFVFVCSMSVLLVFAPMSIDEWCVCKPPHSYPNFRTRCLRSAPECRKAERERAERMSRDVGEAAAWRQLGAPRFLTRRRWVCCVTRSDPLSAIVQCCFSDSLRGACPQYPSEALVVQPLPPLQIAVNEVIR